MKVAIPVLGFSSAGGMRVLSKLADHFIDQGHEVVFFSSHLVNQPYYPTAARVLTYRNPVARIPLLRGVFNLLGMMHFVFKNRSTYDIFLANFYLTAFPLFLGALGTGKVWYYIQAYEPEFFQGGSWLDRISSFLAGLSYFLPVNMIVNGAIYRHYKLLKCDAVVEPGIDLRVYTHRGYRDSAEPLVIGCIGRTLAWKGTREVIEAVGEVRRLAGVDLRLRVAFELPHALDIADYDYVELSQPHGDVALSAFYRDIDVFVATGLLQDGAFHYPCLEAMASGCVVISNYAPATSRSAICVKQVDTTVIVQALLYFLKLPTPERAALVEQAAEEVQQHAWELISTKMMNYFKRER